MGTTNEIICGLLAARPFPQSDEVCARERCQENPESRPATAGPIEVSALSIALQWASRRQGIVSGRVEWLEVCHGPGSAHHIPPCPVVGWIILPASRKLNGYHVCDPGSAF